jgi:hypothetical protein
MSTGSKRKSQRVTSDMDSLSCSDLSELSMSDEAPDNMQENIQLEDNGLGINNIEGLSDLSEFSALSEIDPGLKQAIFSGLMPNTRMPKPSMSAISEMINQLEYDISSDESSDDESIIIEEIQSDEGSNGSYKSRKSKGLNSNSSGIKELSNGSNQMRDSPNRSNQMGESPNRSNQMRDSPNRSNQMGESPNRSNQMRDSPNRSNQMRDSPNRSNQMRDSPNRSNQMRDSSNRSNRMGDSPNRSNQMRDSSNRSNQMRDSSNRSDQMRDIIGNDISGSEDVLGGEGSKSNFDLSIDLGVDPEEDEPQTGYQIKVKDIIEILKHEIQMRKTKHFRGMIKMLKNKGSKVSVAKDLQRTLLQKYGYPCSDEWIDAYSMYCTILYNNNHPDVVVLKPKHLRKNDTCKKDNVRDIMSELRLKDDTGSEVLMKDMLNNTPSHYL